MSIRFWEQKSLTDMNREEWEALCDGCGRCCLQKLEDADSGEIYYTAIACQLLDSDSCRCTEYAERLNKVPDCVRLDQENIKKINWLPLSCAYRRLMEGRGLPNWHPLITGDAESVHRAGISVRGKTFSRDKVPVDDWEDHIVQWRELR